MAGQNRILGVILEVTACKSSSVVVHCRRIPAGDIHLVGHLADALTKSVSQILVPGRRDSYADREADGTYTGEVVVDGGRAVAVVGADFADALDGIGLIAAQGDQGVHVVQSHLIHQLVPLGIVLIKTAHIYELKAVIGAGRNSRRVRVFVCRCCLRCQIIADIVENTKKGGATLTKLLGTSAWEAPAQAICKTIELIFNGTGEEGITCSVYRAFYGLCIGSYVTLDNEGIKNIYNVEGNNADFAASVNAVRNVNAAL